MRTAIISDIHGNIDALNAVSEDIRKQECSSIVCLGDIVGYGYDPCACIDKIVGLPCTSILTGNHDAAVVGKLGLDWFNPVSGAGVLRDRAKIDDERKRILDNLSTQVDVDSRNVGKKHVVYTHGDLDGGYDFPYIDDLYTAYCTASVMERRGIDLLFVGHTHFATCYYYKDRKSLSHAPRVEESDVLENRVFRIDGSMPVIANVGSVGYPRNQPYSVYAIYDDDAMTIEWRKLKFDFTGYCRKLSGAGIPIPSWMFKWVEAGLIDEYEVINGKRL